MNHSNNVESIEKQLQQLRNDFKQENDELKEELFKAEMMAKVLEDTICIYRVLR